MHPNTFCLRSDIVWVLTAMCKTNHNCKTSCACATVFVDMHGTRNSCCGQTDVWWIQFTFRGAAAAVSNVILAVCVSVHFTYCDSQGNAGRERERGRKKGGEGRRRRGERKAAWQAGHYSEFACVEKYLCCVRRQMTSTHLCTCTGCWFTSICNMESHNFSMQATSLCAWSNWNLLCWIFWWPLLCIIDLSWLW